MRIFPQVPSYIELEILNYVNYCSVCNIHDNKTHPMKYCIGCDKDLCEILGDLWYMLPKKSPEQRVTRPEQRVTRPEQRVTRPEQRVTRPEQRVTQLEQKLENKDFICYECRKKIKGTFIYNITFDIKKNKKNIVLL